jgi:sugar lactone lactonase YvrE
MNLRSIPCLLGLSLAFLACHPDFYKVSDRTPEGSFTENCEGPNVDRQGNLFVVNWQKDGTVARIPPGKPAELFVELPKGSTANSIQFDSKGALLLADFTGHNVLKVDPATKAVTVFCHDARFNQPNDLCITKSDVLYASDPNWAKGTGQIWKITPDGTAQLLEKDMGTTNGIALSPDERFLYVNESIQRNIWVFEVTPTGLSNKRLFHYFEKDGLDGMKCDVKGNLYVTRWGAGEIAVFAPNGQLLRTITTQGKKVSNLNFGGKDGKTVFVTLQDRKCVEMFQNEISGKQ